MEESYEDYDEYDYDDQYGDPLDELDKIDEEDEEPIENDGIDITDDVGEESEDEAQDEEEDEDDTDRKDELEEIEDVMNRQSTLKQVNQGQTRHSQPSIKSITVSDSERRTTEVLQPNELALVIAHRAEQISRDGIYYIKQKYIKPERIAYEEIQQRMCPLKIRRLVGVSKNGNHYYEEYSVNQMILPSVGSANDLGFD
jgi:hypothetical protein